MSRTRQTFMPNNVVRCGDYEGLCLTSIYTTGYPYTRAGVDKVVGTSSKTMVDVEIENFKSRSANGEIFNNPMTFSQVSMMDAVCRWRAYGYRDLTFAGIPGGETSSASGSSPTSEMIIQSGVFPVISQSVIDDELETLKELSVTKAWSKVDASEAAALASLGELRQTVTSMGSIYMRAIDILMALKKRDLKFLKGQISAGELTDRYMEARYAIRPLVYDAHQVLAALNNKVQHNRYTARGRADKVLTGDTIEIPVYNMYLPNTQTTLRITYDVRQSTQRLIQLSARAGVLYEVQLTEMLGKAVTWGFDQPIEAVWELTPYSFIIDWFFNIGELISAWTPNAGCSPLSHWVTTEVKDSKLNLATLERVRFYNSDYESTGLTTSPLQIAETTYKKERIPSPGRNFGIHWDVNLDSLKLLDLGIIAKKLLSNLRKSL